jgi:hypothetical protein
MNLQALREHPALVHVVNSQHFIPSLALNNTVLAIALMVRERQGKQHALGSAAGQRQGPGDAPERSSSSSSSSGGGGGREPSQQEGGRGMCPPPIQPPQVSLVEEHTAQALATFADAVRLLPKLTRSHRKLFALLGVDPRVGVWAAVMLAQPTSPFQQRAVPVGESTYVIHYLFR